MIKKLFILIIFFIIRLMFPNVVYSKCYKNYESSIINSECNQLNKVFRTKCQKIKNGISHCVTNDIVFNDIIPNPVVYWYATSINDDPILLLNFKAGLPLRCLAGRLITDLDAIILKLKIPIQHGYHFKILKIDGETTLQTITYSKTNSMKSKLEPSYNGASAGSVEYSRKNLIEYEAKYPIVTFFGVSSDTLSVMIRKGEKYPISNCQITVSMLVRGIKEKPCEEKSACDFYRSTLNPGCDLRFNKSIVQVEKKPIFIDDLPIIAKVIALPLTKLFYPKKYDVKVIKLDKKDNFTTSRVLKGSHVEGSNCKNQRYIMNFWNGKLNDDDILYKEMGLPHKWSNKCEP